MDNQEYKSWLAGLKVGDEVAVALTGGIRGYTIRKVVRAMKLCVVVGSTEFSRKDGNESGYRYPLESIHPVTPEILVFVKRRNLANAIRGVDLDAVGRVLSRVTHPSADHPLARSLGELPNAQKTGSIPDMRFRRMLKFETPALGEDRLVQAIGMLGGRVDANQIAYLMAVGTDDRERRTMAMNFYNQEWADRPA